MNKGEVNTNLIKLIYHLILIDGIGDVGNAVDEFLNGPTSLPENLVKYLDTLKYKFDPGESDHVDAINFLDLAPLPSEGTASIRLCPVCQGTKIINSEESAKDASYDGFPCPDCDQGIIFILPAD